jgi:hypothetical protein
MSKADKIIITQSNYIPWKGYFDAIACCDCFVIYDDTQYTKRDWRNRNIIKTDKGLVWLTIPVEVKGKFGQKINETKIADKNWNVKHWKILQCNYRKAPCYSEVKDWIEPVYMNCKFELLTEVNQYFLEAVLEYFEIKVKIERSENFDLSMDRTLRLVNICKQFSAKEYFTGPAAKAYLNEGHFFENDIKINYLNYDGYKPYMQLGEGFEHSVSIIDLIFNMGKKSIQYLKNIK